MKFKIGDFVRLKNRDGKIYRVVKVHVKMDGSWIEVRSVFSMFQAKTSKCGEYDPDKFVLVSVEEIQAEIDKLVEIQKQVIVSDVMDS